MNDEQRFRQCYQVVLEASKADPEPDRSGAYALTLEDILGRLCHVLGLPEGLPLRHHALTLGLEYVEPPDYLEGVPVFVVPRRVPGIPQPEKPGALLPLDTLNPNELLT